jgi:hypothetical protein
MPKGQDFAGTNQPFSVEFWARPDDVPSLAFLIDNENMSVRGGWDIVLSDHVSFERYASDTEYVTAFGTTPLAPQSWHHIVGVCDSTDQALWIDGALAGGGPGSITLPSVTVGWMVGAQDCHPEPCTTNGFVGAVDELAVYGRALGQDEVQAHFQAAK